MPPWVKGDPECWQELRRHSKYSARMFGREQVRGGLSVLAVAATLLALVVVATRPAVPLSQQPFPDSYEYSNAAWELAHGHGYVTFVKDRSLTPAYGTKPEPPRYPFGTSVALAPFTLVFGRPHGAQIGARVFVLGYVIVVVVAAWMLGGPLGGLIAAAFLSISPFVDRTATLILSDPLGALLTVLILIALIRRTRNVVHRCRARCWGLDRRAVAWSVGTGGSLYRGTPPQQMACPRVLVAIHCGTRLLPMAHIRQSSQDRLQLLAARPAPIRSWLHYRPSIRHRRGADIWARSEHARRQGVWLQSNARPIEPGLLSDSAIRSYLDLRAAIDGADRIGCTHLVA